jgi:hypothetical protein
MRRRAAASKSAFATSLFERPLSVTDVELEHTCSAAAVIFFSIESHDSRRNSTSADSSSFKYDWHSFLFADCKNKYAKFNQIYVHT